MMTEAIQAAVSAVLLALGLALRGWLFGDVVAFSPGVFLAVLGGIGMFDYFVGVVVSNLGGKR